MMLQVATPPTPPEFPVQVFQTPAPWETLPPMAVTLICLGFFATCAVVLVPLIRALARRLEGKALPDAKLGEEIEQLRARMNEMDALQHRVMELEERVDFTERLLAQKREADRLPRSV